MQTTTDKSTISSISLKNGILSKKLTLFYQQLHHLPASYNKKKLKKDCLMESIYVGTFSTKWGFLEEMPIFGYGGSQKNNLFNSLTYC